MNRIFVSCGQLTEEERSAGLSIKNVIDSTAGFSAYFAQTVQSLEALTNHVFDAIRGCVGAVVVLHRREQFDHGGQVMARSSVWINQEIAILAYRQFVERPNLPILCFAEDGIMFEDAMTRLIVNAHPLGPNEAVTTRLERWLKEARFHGGAEDLFESHWQGLSESDVRVLAAVVDRGGVEVRPSSVRNTLTERYGLSSDVTVQPVRSVLAAATRHRADDDARKSRPSDRRARSVVASGTCA